MELRIEAMAPKMEETKEESDSVREGILYDFRLLSFAPRVCMGMACVFGSLCPSGCCRVQRRVWRHIYRRKSVAQI